jgi:hypothetical protein
VSEGRVVQQARGIYVAANHAPTEAHTLAQVAKREPEAVFCLFTALRFHDWAKAVVAVARGPTHMWQNVD